MRVAPRGGRARSPDDDAAALGPVVPVRTERRALGEEVRDVLPLDVQGAPRGPGEEPRVQGRDARVAPQARARALEPGAWPLASS
jgi:hypothetical protein